MKLYYCFNGLCDYEYFINEEQVIEILYRIIGIAIEYEAVEFYFKMYYEDILEKFNDSAYWEYLSETKADIIDSRRLNKYCREIRAEDYILGMKRNDEIRNI